MIKTILTALTESLILESYKDVKTRFINAGADKDEVSKLLDLHKKLKDMNRLKKDEVNIDVLVKGKSFDEFKTLMSRYSEKDTETKTDKWTALKNKIVAENDEWTVYAIDTPEEAYLFHGLVKWCISSGTKSAAKKYFNEYRFEDAPSIFFAIVRKNPIGDEYDYIMDQYNWEDDIHTYWNAKDVSYRSLNKDLNVPPYENAIYKNNENAKSDLKNRALNVLKLNDDGTYSCTETLSNDMVKHFIKNGRFTIKFKEVNGNFDCSRCGLTSLEGCPEKVGIDFYCNYNKTLTSLEGAPKEVGRDFWCNNSNLTSIEGAPKKVGGVFGCNENNLTSLEGAPKEVGGSFLCGDNKLTTLKGAPEKVGGIFGCSNNKLTSLEGMPKEVGKGIYCNNNELTSIKGVPEKVYSDFDCSDNNLKSLKGAPKEVGGYFSCKNNKDLKSLDGIGKVKGKIIADIKK